MAFLRRYIVRMRDRRDREDELCREAIEARKRFEEAFNKAVQESEEKDLHGQPKHIWIEQQTKELWDAMLQTRYIGLLEDRDKKILNRGTTRGILIVVGILLLLWSTKTIYQGYTTETGGLVPISSGIGYKREVIGEEWVSPDRYGRELQINGFLGALVAGGLFIYVWSLSRIPPLDEEDENGRFSSQYKIKIVRTED